MLTPATGGLPRMAATYRNSYITIPASGAASSAVRRGLFRHASLAHIERNLIIIPEGLRMDPCQIFYREPNHHNALSLQSRGWVLQEALLSPRVIHFGPTELLFEFTKMTTCQ